jgi:hypothetical protein
VALNDDEEQFLRLVFEESGGLPGRFIPLTEVPVAAIALHNKRLLIVQQISPSTWTVALTGNGSAEAHVRFVE